MFAIMNTEKKSSAIAKEHYFKTNKSNHQLVTVSTIEHEENNSYFRDKIIML